MSAAAVWAALWAGVDRGTRGLAARAFGPEFLRQFPPPDPPHPPAVPVPVGGAAGSFVLLPAV